MIEAIKACEGGYCRQFLAMVDRRSWRLVRFQAVFFALRHSRDGWVLVDTGYGTQFHTATERFPARFYRWATPVTPAGSATELLGKVGIRAADIRHVVITHFHADHVGGLAEFPHATIHYHGEALAPLQTLSPVRQVRAAFLARLIPAWLPARGLPIAPRAFSPAPDLPFEAHDLFDDGSIRLVHLPGHAPGQIGIAFTGPNGPALYSADAYWRRCQVASEVEPLGVARAFQWDSTAYRHTTRLLRQVYHRGLYQLSSCHDEGTCFELNRPAAKG